MGILRVRFDRVDVGPLGDEIGSPGAGDVLAHFRQRLVGHAGRVGAHVGDEPDRAFPRQLDPLVELLGEQHRLLDGEARGLLQLAGDKRRRGRLSPLLRGDAAHHPARPLEVGQNLTNLGLARQPDRVVALAQQPRVELRGRRGRQAGGQMPVLLGDEVLDLPLAVADELQRDRLHAPGAQAAADFFPEQRADLVADEPIEHAPSLLRVDHAFVDRPRPRQRGQHRPLGDLVEHQPVNPLGPTAQLFGDMPADRFALPIRIGRHIDNLDLPRGVPQRLEHLSATRDDLVRWLEPALDVHPEPALGQVLDMTHRGDDLEVLAQIFVDGLRLSGRFDDHQRLCHTCCPRTRRPVRRSAARRARAHPPAGDTGQPAFDFEL